MQFATSMQRAALVVFASLLLANACSDRPSTDPEVVAWRLVDAPAVDGAPVPGGKILTREAHLASATQSSMRGPARAVIQDEMHYTFTRRPLEFVYHDASFVVPDADQWPFEVGVPAEHVDCTELLAQVSLTAGLEHSEQWPIGMCTGPPLARRLALDLVPPPTLRGKTADLWVHVRPIGDGRVVRRRFTIDRVPAGARLAFAYGVEAAGWEPRASPVRFHVLADGEPAPLFYARLDPALNREQRRWYMDSVDLARWAGRPLTLVLQTSLDPASDRRAFSDARWGDPMVLARVPQSARRPWNVLLISLDTLRAKSLAAYGRERPTSPFLDAFAREGTLFEHAIAPASNTPPSHMSIFTGLYPSAHGVTGLTNDAMSDAHTTLAETLRREGYVTGAVTEDGALQAQLGFERGFDTYHENKSADLATPLGQIQSTFRHATEWLAAHRHEPFFLFVHTYQVHDPYNPPPEYRGTFGDPGASGPTADVDRYEEGVRYADAEVAELWAKITTLGLADRTLVIVTSDHGEEFAEHGALKHGANLYDESLAVPLVMHAPGLVPAGLRVPQQVGLIDVTPTVLALLGLAPIPAAQGVSLTPLFGPDQGAQAALAKTLDERTLFAEAWAPFRVLKDGSFDPQFHAPNFAQRSRGLKLIWTPAAPPAAGRLEAYDLATDPAERNDLAAADAERFRAGREALQAYATAAPADGTAAAQAGAPATAPPAAPDPATHEKLRALGYIR